VKRIINLIDPKKDVDCFHPENVGKVFLNQAIFMPCTPAGILELLKRNTISVEGKNIVIIGRSNIVGKPLAVMFINLGATVTVCNSKTKNLATICKQADILISATGKAGLIKVDMVKQDAVVIDVGMNRDAEGKLVGDVDYFSVCAKTSYEMSFIRPMAAAGYPRFHMYVKITGTDMLINIHLDVKKETYGENTRHHGEYSNDGALKEEVRRLKVLLD